MSTLTAPTSAHPAAPSRTSHAHLTFLHLVRSEWIKLWTVRSTYWIVPLTVLAFVGFSLLTAIDPEASGASPDGGPADLGTLLVPGLYLGQLAFVVLAVLSVTGEYSTGMIRSTFAAAPARLPALAAKLVVLLVVALLTGLAATALTYLATLPMLDDAEAVDLAAEQTRRVVVGVPLYLAGISMLAFALGVLLRHSAAALSAVLGMLTVVPIVFAVIPNSFLQKTSVFLPGNAGLEFLSPDDAGVPAGMPDVPQLTGWEGFAVLAAWGVLVLVVAAVLVRRRDA